MAHLSKRFSQISESQTVALTSLMNQMKRKGIDVVGLGAGEPDFDTPDHIKEAAIQSIKDGFTKYTAADGIPELKESICDLIKEEHGAEYSPGEVVVTVGAKHAVYQGILAVCDPGDEVILPAPYWVSYPEQIKLAGATPKVIETSDETNFKISPEQLKDAITDKTRLLILNSPSNPSGSVYTKEEIDRLVEVIKESGIYVMSDEIYDKIIYDDLEFVSLTSYPEIREQLLLVNGVSKSFAMTGWRIGYLACPKEIATAIKRYQGHSTSNPTSISQKAAVAAIQGQKEFIKDMLKAFTERRDYVYRRLNAIPGVKCVKPQGAFYAFPNISYYFGKSYKGTEVNSSPELCQHLLQNFNVAIVPGSAFGMDTNVRLSFATSMQVLEKALDRIEAGLKALA